MVHIANTSSGLSSPQQQERAKRELVVKVAQGTEHVGLLAGNYLKKSGFTDKNICSSAGRGILQDAALGMKDLSGGAKGVPKARLEIASQQFGAIMKKCLDGAKPSQDLSLF